MTNRAILAAVAATLALWGCETLEPNPGPQPGDPSTERDASGGDIDAGLPGDDATAPREDDGGGAGGGGGETDAGMVSEDAQQWLDGRLLYFRYCAVCHGSDGTGGPPWPETIRNMTETYEVVTEGRGEMPGFPSLTAEDVLSIELFLTDDGDVVRPDEPDEPPPDIELPPLTPLEQYATECAVCHGVEGTGTVRGPQIQFPVRDYASFVTRRGRVGPTYPEAMDPYPVAQIAEAALAEIWDWLHAMPRPVDGEGLYTVFCGNCHGPAGSGSWFYYESIRGEDLYEYFYVVREGEGGRDYSDREEYMPAWTEAELSNEEIQAIWLYVTGGFPIGDDDDDHDDDHDEDDDYDDDYDE